MPTGLRTPIPAGRHRGAKTMPRPVGAPEFDLAATAPATRSVTSRSTEQDGQASRIVPAKRTTPLCDGAEAVPRPSKSGGRCRRTGLTHAKAGRPARGAPLLPVEARPPMSQCLSATRATPPAGLSPRPFDVREGEVETCPVAIARVEGRHQRSACHRFAHRKELGRSGRGTSTGESRPPRDAPSLFRTREGVVETWQARLRRT